MFPGFFRPKANFFKVPNDWFDLWIQVRQETGQSRIAGLLKATEYTLKWSWGYQNYDQPVRISYRNFQFGMLRGGRRHDRGTGLSSRGVQNALAKLLELNILERHESENGNGGQAYLPHLQPPEEDEDAFLGTTDVEPKNCHWEGFERPETNYFEVPATWTDLTCGVTSATVILSVEYFFRHTWGWHRNQETTRPIWMTVEEVAAGRRDRTGERYDDGTGYTVRSVRPALEEAVRRGWLVWRIDERTGRKQYALHLKGMVVSEHGEWLGYQEADEANNRGCAPAHAPPLEEEISDVPPSPAPETGTDHATEIARLQAQVAALTETVAHLQAVIHRALGPTALQQLEPSPALASLVEDSKAPGEDSKALGEESKAPQGRWYSASYTDSASESEEQKVAAAESVASLGDAAAAGDTPSLSLGSSKSDKHELARLLDRLGIRGCRRREVEANATYPQALAWTLYAATQPGLTRNKAGYIVQRLVETEPAPAEFLALALPLEMITLFRRAVRYGGPYCQAIPDEMTAQFSEWQRRFPLQNTPTDDGSRRGRNWDPLPAKKGDSLEDLLGSAEVEPESTWAAACGLLEGQLPDEALEALQRCRVTESHVWPGPRILLWPPEDDPAAGAVLSAHLEGVKVALTGMGIYHTLEVEEVFHPAFLESE